MKYFDKLKDYLKTPNSIRQYVEKVEESEDVEKSEIDLGDSCEYSLSKNVKIEEADDSVIDAKIPTGLGKVLIFHRDLSGGW